MSAMRVAFILPNLAGGGAERVALTLIEDLLAQGCKVDLVLADGRGELLPLVPPDVRVIGLSAPRLRNALLPLVRYFRERRPDSTQVFMWPLTAVAIIAHRIARRPGRIVTSDHVALSKQYGSNPGTMASVRVSTRLTYPVADARICVSEESADDLARLSGLSRGAFAVINNPVTPPNAAGEESAAWISGTAKRILTVGALKPVKNQELLLDAFALVVRQRDMQIAIIGEGECRGDLRQHAESLAIADRVSFPGFQLDPSAWYASADLFVLSSDYEGYPLALVEALGAGLNVVSTDCGGGVRNILDSGRFGRLVSVGDVSALASAIEQALDNPLRPADLKRRAAELSDGALGAYRRIMLEGGAPASSSQGARASR